MNIADLREGSKRLLATVRHEGFGAMIARTPRNTLVIGLLFLVAIVSFGAGLLLGRSVGQGSVLVETVPLATSSIAATLGTLPQGGQVVASRNGTKYYLPWCGGAKRLSEATKVWFSSAQDAQAHGYTPAKNCSGL